MAQVLLDVADMAVDFEKSHGYSLPTFNIQYVSSANSSSSYRSTKPPIKGTQQPQLDQKNPNVGIARENTTKRTAPQPPKKSSPSKYKATKERTA